MKESKRLVIMMFVSLLVLFSCSDSENENDTSFPTISTSPSEIDDVDWGQTDIEHIVIYCDDGVIVISFPNPEDLILKINDFEINNLEWEFESDVDAWIAEVDWEELPANFLSGNDIQYSLSFNNDTQSGSLAVPYNIVSNFPNFNFNEDYTFNWSIEENPDLFFVALSFYSDSTSVYNGWQINDGDAREYLISSSIYQDYENSFDEFWLTLDAINYTRNDDFLAYSIKGSEYGNARNNKKNIKVKFLNVSKIIIQD